MPLSDTHATPATDLAERDMEDDAQLTDCRNAALEEAAAAIEHTVFILPNIPGGRPIYCGFVALDAVPPFDPQNRARAAMIRALKRPVVV